jgi:CHAT domain-containing protein
MLWPPLLQAQLKEDTPVEREIRALEQQRKYEEALAVAQRGIAEAEAQFGPEHPEVAWLLVWAARQNRQLTRYQAADRDLRRALGIFRKAGERSGEARTLSQLSNLQNSHGDFKGALESSIAALEVYRTAVGPDDIRLADALNNVGSSYYKLTRLPEAETHWREALAIRRRVLPANDPDILKSLFNLAIVDYAQGRLDSARYAMEEVVTAKESLAAEDPDGLASALSFLSLINSKQSRFSEAERLQLRGLEIRERALGQRHPKVAESLINLGTLYNGQERFGEAERVWLRAIEILDGEERKNFFLLGATLTNLGANYIDQQRFEEALPLLQRALALQIAQYGENQQAVVVARTNLGRVYQRLGRLPEAAGELKSALAAAEKLGLGRDEQTIRLLIFNADVLRLQQRLDDADQALRTALERSESVFGTNSVRTAEVLGGLGVMAQQRGRFADAEALLTRAADIRCDSMPTSPACAEALDSLSIVKASLKREAEALELARRATRIDERRRQDRLLGTDAIARAEHRRARGIYMTLLSHLTSDSLPPNERMADAFKAVQALRSSQTAQQVAKMAARQASGAGPLASLTRQRQDLEGELERIDKELGTALASGERSATTVANLRQQRTDAQGRMAVIDQEIARVFPAYKNLIDPVPMRVSEAQRLLHAGEALFSVAVGSAASFAFLITPGDAVFRRVDISQDALAAIVTRLRRHLDPATAGEVAGEPFPYADARTLYTLLLAPFEPQLQTVKHLLIVPDGPLQSLPPSVLLTGDVQAPAVEPIPWLIRRYAISILPAESALSALRAPVVPSMTGSATVVAAAQPFIGFGDPLLSGAPGPLRTALRSGGSGGSRRLAPSDALRQLPRLPETRAELRSISKALGADDRSLYLGEQANETRIKTSRLDTYRVIAFATHGLVADELPGIQEPALVLTPPATPSDQDDGLLTASEIATLNLSADWVVLSACNTAAGDGSTGAEGLSGLSKAFFYAGARSLLVSHWSVDSEASVALTTRTFGAYAGGQSKAEALRTAALQMMSVRKGGRRYDHPMYWAPFVIVGDGATTKAGAARAPRAPRPAQRT